MREIKVGLGATINLGNFNSVRIDYSETDNVPDDGDIEKAREELYASVDAFVSKMAEDAQRDYNG